MTTEKQQTPLQKHIEWLKKSFDCNNDFKAYACLTHAESLLPEEKQMVIDAYERGDKYKFEISGEQYFNETYEQ